MLHLYKREKTLSNISKTSLKLLPCIHHNKYNGIFKAIKNVHNEIEYFRSKHLQRNGNYLSKHLGIVKSQDCL